ncbi:MAG: DUF3099 domain-containing protein [Gulosibacter sp.]|uniref:DUF3099 domain-containing protein n=1 Tax=Gulosibacter sp. TaxID=2817531 RepID=UPI003F9108A7
MEESAEEERQHRTRQYLMTMAIRTACVLLMVFVRGPLLWFVAAGAIFLPWIAVVIANHVRQRKLQPVESPDRAAVVVYHEPVVSEQWQPQRDVNDDDQDAGTSKNAEDHTQKSKEAPN